MSDSGRQIGDCRHAIRREDCHLCRQYTTPTIDTAKARSVLAKMTPGEWETIENVRASGDCVWSPEIGDVAQGMSTKDARGIAFLRNNAPAWLDAIDALAAALRERDAEIERLKARNEEVESFDNKLCEINAVLNLDLAAMRRRCEEAEAKLSAKVWTVPD